MPHKEDTQGRKLILHIGSHKTGTTSIQRSLYFYRHELQEKTSFQLFCKKPAGKEDLGGNANAWIPVDFSSMAGGRLNPDIYEQLDRIEGNVIISAENFSWFFLPQRIDELKLNLSSIFSEIKIVAYLRRQDKQLLSQYQEASKNTVNTHFRFFGNKNSALPEHQEYFAHYLDYNKRIGRWADIFEDKNIFLRVFEQQKLAMVA